MNPALIGLRALAKQDAKTILTGVGIAAGAALLVYLVIRNAGFITSTLTKGALDAGSGVVLGVGDAIGIPRTNQSACDQAIADGRTLDASFACPAGRFISSLFGSAGDEQAKPIDRAGDSSGVPDTLNP